MIFFFITLVLLLAFIAYIFIAERCFRIELQLDYRNLPGPRGTEKPPSQLPTSSFRSLTDYRHSILRTATLDTKSKILALVYDPIGLQSY